MKGVFADSAIAEGVHSPNLRDRMVIHLHN